MAVLNDPVDAAMVEVSAARIRRMQAWRSAAQAPGALGLRDHLRPPFEQVLMEASAAVKELGTHTDDREALLYATTAARDAFVRLDRLGRLYKLLKSVRGQLVLGQAQEDTAAKFAEFRAGTSAFGNG